MLKKLSLLLLATFLHLPIILTATETTISENFDGDIKNLTSPSRPFLKIVDGALVNKTDYASHMGVKDKNIGNFTLSFKIKFFKGSENLSGHFTVGIDRGYGIWHLYFTTNANIAQITSKFALKGDKKAKAPFNEIITPALPLDKWINITITANKNRYELKVGEETFILGTAPGFGKISFGSYRQPFAMDDFKLTYSKPKKLSPNLLINGSLEHATNPDIPDCWAGNGERYRTQGLPTSIYTKKSIDEFREKFFLDKSNAFHGKNSLRVESPYFLLSKITKVSKNNNYFASCYIKSDSDGQKVKLGATFDSIKKPVKEKIIEVGKKWKRYTLNLTKYPQNKLSFFVKPINSGKIWVDAVQIESGDIATPFMSCWYDSGFSLPEDVNKKQCTSNTKPVIANTRPNNLVPNKDITISDLKLISLDPLKKSYSLNMKVNNKTDKEKKINVTACLTAKSESEQLKIISQKFPAAQTQNLKFDDFVIKKDLRVCVNTIISNDKGEVIRQTRQFIDVPQPMRIYTDWSFYTKEKEAGIVVQFDCDIKKLKNCTLKLEVFAAGYHQYPRVKKSFPVNTSAHRQIFKIPVNHMKSGKIFTVRARLINRNKKKLMEAETRLTKHYSSQTEVKVNRINRGVYINGKPFIPYGILVSRLNEKQLEYYKKCGFSYIKFVSNWNKVDDNLKFLEDCDKLGIKAVAFHVARPYVPDPADIAKIYKKSPALVGIMPNDEIAYRVVYYRAIKLKSASPAILNWGNHHFHSYRAFANRIDGFPGDVLSIDRYPFIIQPPGRPQITNDIYSYELCLEMMDRDGKRERKPVYTWIQGAERFSKEPTPQQLTWQTYVALINHCTGFTYFGGIPSSKRVWERMQSLNVEVQTLKPALFSLEEEPEVNGIDQKTKDNIRILTKKLGDEITIICLNDTLYPIDATFDLSKAGISSKKDIDVLFESRKIKTDKGVLKDKFKPFERHVYKIRKDTTW